MALLAPILGAVLARQSTISPPGAASEAARLRPVAGRVVDREGRPIAGAKVFQSGDGPARSEATTDADGRFRLDGVYAGPALVFAEKDGYRFGGALAREDAVKVRLAPVNGPPIRVLKLLAPKLSRAEERRLGLALLAPALACVRSGEVPSGHAASEWMVPEEVLARLDPDRALAMVEDRVIVRPGEVVRQAAIAQYENDPREAVATIEADRDPRRERRDTSRSPGRRPTAGGDWP